MTKRKPILAAKKLGNIATDYYQELDRASKDPSQKVAWCSSVGPAELLLAFDFKVYYPENHTAAIGSSRAANKYIPVAVAQGYSPEICSYLTSDIGAFLMKETVLTKAYGLEEVPKPDVLVYNTNQCRDIQEWFAFYARTFNVPLLGIHSPKNIGNINQSHISFVEEQLKQMCHSLEKISGNDFEKKKLEKTVQLSLETSILWNEVLETATVVPSPFTFFDGCIHMFPAVVLRGEQISVDYYRLLAQELEERVENGVAAVENERYRLYWDGMPIWGKLRANSEQFLELRACVVASTYCNSWIFNDFSHHAPFSSMAKAYTKLFINRSESSKEKYLQEMIQKFQINGIIFHNARTCPHNSNTSYGMPKRMEEQTKIPNLVIDADLNDLNVYSEEQTKTNIEAFIEQLAGI
ncbi:MAG: 2-hydroxyacyl-CoA dehydratase [Candidatus Heimdallarchaeota archaeon]|nr:MAG: 2-hydroxyacyl-CoA dehydratase [Candidatus Heimdallarchaeota archaeon]